MITKSFEILISNSQYLRLVWLGFDFGKARNLKKPSSLSLSPPFSVNNRSSSTRSTLDTFFSVFRIHFVEKYPRSDLFRRKSWRFCYVFSRILIDSPCVVFSEGRTATRKKMEFQEGLMRFVIDKSMYNKWVFEKDREKADAVTERKASPGRKWRIFRRSSSKPSKPLIEQAPTEFLCPITRALMAEPVIVSSGHTFEAVCVQACKVVNFIPKLSDGSLPDFSSVISNLALKSAILNWCKNSSMDPPKPLDFSSAKELVCSLMASQNQNSVLQREPEEEPIQRVVLNQFYSNSDESVDMLTSTPPLALKTRPSCCSSSSSSDIETLIPNSLEEEEIMAKIQSPQIIEIEESLVSLRKMTRTREECRAQLCTLRLLSALKPLILSRYTAIQVHAVAAVVNLSLEKTNKVKMVRSGLVPNLIDALKGGFPEAQEHAAGALFSLSLDDVNKTAIGVLGALPPLIRSLLSESERTRHDSVLALYHLSLVQSNRSKLVKLGAVSAFLGLVQSSHMTGRVLMILANLASCVDGRAALLDSGAVGCIVGILRSESSRESTRESCVDVLFGLSDGGLRFKGLAKAAGAVEVLMDVEKKGGSRGREKARRMMEMMKERGEDEDEDFDWENLLDPGLEARIQSQLGGGAGGDSSEL